LLAERRMKTPAISKFLHDPDPHLVLEAIRAIYDTPIPEILPEVAGLLTPTESAFSPASSTSDIYGWLMGSSKLPWPTHVSYSRSEWSSWVLRRAVNAANRLGGTPPMRMPWLNSPITRHSQKRHGSKHWTHWRTGPSLPLGIKSLDFFNRFPHATQRLHEMPSSPSGRNLLKVHRPRIGSSQR